MWPAPALSLQWEAEGTVAGPELPVGAARPRLCKHRSPPHPAPQSKAWSSGLPSALACGMGGWGGEFGGAAATQPIGSDLALPTASPP